MKKHLLNILFIGITGTIFAQPTLTQVGCAPIVGDFFPVNTGNYVSPGPSGANQNWNLTSITPTSVTNYSAVTVASTPNGASFPGASICLFGSPSTYFYFNSTSSTYEFYGLNQNPSVHIYSDPEDQLHFPFNYTDTYNDNLAAISNSSAPNFTRTGVVNVTYDGYGTLTLPNGVFNNVARVHRLRTLTDNFASSTITYTYNVYDWYMNGTHYPVATVFTASNSLGGNGSYGYYLNNLTTNVSQNSFTDYELNISPNPANDILQIELKGNENEIKVYDVSGKIVLSNKTENSGTDKITLNVTGLENGVYFIKTISGSGVRNRKVIIQH